MNSEDRTTILPATGSADGAGGRSGGRAARRAAERHADRHGGRGRRGRRRGGFVPVSTVVVAVAGTGLLAALAGAGYAAYAGRQSDRDPGQAVALDALMAAEAGTHEGIQVPGAGGGPALVPGTPQPPVNLAATDPGSPSPTTSVPGSATATATASATPTPTVTSTAAPTPTAKPTTGQRSTAASAPSATSAPTSVGGGASPSYAQQVVDLVNAERAKAGCDPVAAEPRLATAAQSHSDDMADRNYFDHASPEGYHADHRIEATGYRWSTWGENIARGQKDPAAVMDAWMNSPGHRANILNCAFKQLGVGVRTGSGGPWWTQVFAAPA